jgi:hypothetical protein
MNRRNGRRRKQHSQGDASPNVHAKPAAAAAGDQFAEPNAMGKRSHSASEGSVLHEGRCNAECSRELQRARRRLGKNMFARILDTVTKAVTVIQIT